MKPADELNVESCVVEKRMSAEVIRRGVTERMLSLINEEILIFTMLKGCEHGFKI